MNKELPSEVPPMLTKQEAAEHAVPAWLAEVINGYEAEAAAMRKQLFIVSAQLARANARAEEISTSKNLEALPAFEDDYEIRDDGQRVRKDRWKTGILNIVSIFKGSRSGFEIDELVAMVRKVAELARADYESGGDGTPLSVPLPDADIERSSFETWFQKVFHPATGGHIIDDYYSDGTVNRIEKDGVSTYESPYVQALWTAWQARAALGAPAVPTDWQAVPRSMTDTMWALPRSGGKGEYWESVLAAAPALPSPTMPSLLAAVGAPAPVASE